MSIRMVGAIMTVLALAVGFRDGRGTLDPPNPLNRLVDAVPVAR
jgi:hypothetical protein